MISWKENDGQMRVLFFIVTSFQKTTHFEESGYSYVCGEGVLICTDSFYYCSWVLVIPSHSQGQLLFQRVLWLGRGHRGWASLAATYLSPSHWEAKQLIYTGKNKRKERGVSNSSKSLGG